METPKYKRVLSRFIDDVTPEDIANHLKIKTEEVLQYLFVAIGEGQIKRSDLFLMLAKKYGEETNITMLCDGTQKPLEIMRGKVTAFIHAGLASKTCDCDELMLYVTYRMPKVFLGDIYVFIAEIERTLHAQIKSMLERKHGGTDKEWWMKGVPKSVRTDCAKAKENDSDAYTGDVHLYSYTTLIHLKEILKKPDNENLFRKHLPVLLGDDLQSFCCDLDRLNMIRNQVMHPIREQLPTENDFLFVSTMHKNIVEASWR